MASNRARIALYLRRGGAKYPEIAEHLGVSAGRARQLALRAARAEARLYAPEREPLQAVAGGKIRQETRARPGNSQTGSDPTGLAGGPDMWISHLRFVSTGHALNKRQAVLPSRAEVVDHIRNVYLVNDVPNPRAQLKDLRREYMIAYVASRLAREPHVAAPRNLREEAIVILDKRHSHFRTTNLNSLRRNPREERYVRTGRVMWYKILKTAGLQTANAGVANRFRIAR